MTEHNLGKHIRKYGMRELKIDEITSVSGGNPVAVFIGGAIVGGLIYDGIKSAAGWWADTFLASDGSGGSRYPFPSYTGSSGSGSGA